jgi:hypothetical protein
VRLTLVLGALGRAPAHVLQAAGEPVAQLLELLEAQHAGTGESLARGAREARQGRGAGR